MTVCCLAGTGMNTFAEHFRGLSVVIIAHVVVGTYEKCLYGFASNTKYKEECQVQRRMVTEFACETHVGSVTSLACSFPHLVSGGDDEIIRFIFSMCSIMEVSSK